MSDRPDSSALEPLRIQTRLQSRYTVFDASGRLPFDIVFGFRRRSDSDPRDISFQTTNSFLDVPYALAHGILSLHELRTSATGSKERIEVDLSRLREAITDNEPPLKYMTLPSKSNRTAMRGQMGVTVYNYRVNPGSPLASLFESGKKYRIALANRNWAIIVGLEAIMCLCPVLRSRLRSAILNTAILSATLTAASLSLPWWRA